MARINEGTWFAYQLTVTESGRTRSDPTIEKYTVQKIEGQNVLVQKEINGKDVGQFNTTRGHGSCVFDMASLSKRGSENMNTGFGHMYVNIFESAGDGESERIFLGKDNIVFRDIRTRKKSDDVLITETRELCWTSMKL